MFVLFEQRKQETGEGLGKEKDEEAKAKQDSQFFNMVVTDNPVDKSVNVKDVTRVNVKDPVVVSKTSLDDAIFETGFGKYSIVLLVTCCLLMLAMTVDIFGFSIVLPVVACDMNLSTNEQGLLSAIPLIGTLVSSYFWGLCADTLGRRTTLLIAMPLASIFNLAAGFAPNFATLAVLKFLSACCTSSSNAAAIVLVGESAPAHHRNRFMFLVASVSMMGQLTICSFALPTLRLRFNIEIPWLHLVYRPWRLLLQLITLPAVIGTIGLLFLHESPKYLLSKGHENKVMEMLKSIYELNTGQDKKFFPISSVYLDETLVATKAQSGYLRSMWDQTAPLFKPPLLNNSLKIYFILLCAMMTSTGFTMWIPTMINTYFNGDDRWGQNFCEVASLAATTNKTILVDCDNAIKPLTLYAIMCYSGGCSLCNFLLSFLVSLFGKKKTTISIYIISSISGILLMFVKVPLLSIVLFSIFLYVTVIFGNVNAYLVELNPTYLRGMASCLSVVVSRGFGFFSVQLIAVLLGDHCTPMIVGYIALVVAGLVVSFYLPPDSTTTSNNKDEKKSQY